MIKKKKAEKSSLWKKEKKKKKERELEVVLHQECFWDSEWNQRWGFSFGHWWWEPFCHKSQWNLSAQKPWTRPSTTELQAWTLRHFPFFSVFLSEVLLCGGKFEVRLMDKMCFRHRERDFVIYRSEVRVTIVVVVCVGFSFSVVSHLPVINIATGSSQVASAMSRFKIYCLFFMFWHRKVQCIFIKLKKKK